MSLESVVAAQIFTDKQEKMINTSTEEISLTSTESNNSNTEGDNNSEKHNTQQRK